MYLRAEMGCDETVRDEWGTENGDPDYDIQNFIDFMKKYKKIDWTPESGDLFFRYCR